MPRRACYIKSRSPPGETQPVHAWRSASVSPSCGRSLSSEQEQTMRKLMVGIAGVMFTLSPISAQEPTCRSRTGPDIPNTEVQPYPQRAIEYGLVDQQIRAVDIGKTNLDVGVVYRGKLAKPA